MDILDQILENLELERDLGTRTVEMDRALLVPPSAASAALPEPPRPVSAPRPQAAADDAARQTPSPAARQVPAPVRSTPPSAQPAPASQPQCDVDIAFFTGRPLSAKGAEAMEKTFGAMRKIKPGITVSLNEERKAKICVLLGSDALLKRLPSARPMRGGWESVDGTPAITTFSPDYIFKHFQEGSPNMNKAKLEMWNDIKSAVARLR